MSELVRLAPGWAPELQRRIEAQFGWTTAGFETVLGSDRGLCLGLQSGARLEAVALGHVVPPEANLDLLWVDGARRRRGHGRRLLQAWLKMAREQGSQEAWLEVSARNPAALRLYGEAGFSKTGQRTRYYRDGSDAVMMRRWL